MVGSEVGVGIGSLTGSGVVSWTSSEGGTGVGVGSPVGSSVGNGSLTGAGVGAGVGAGSIVGVGSGIPSLNAEATVSPSRLSDANDNMKGITVVRRAKHNAKALIFMIRPPREHRFILKSSPWHAKKTKHGLWATSCFYYTVFTLYNNRLYDAIENNKTKGIKTEN